jgi:hypothetical protein
MNVVLLTAPALGALARYVLADGAIAATAAFSMSAAPACGWDT